MNICHKIADNFMEIGQFKIEPVQSGFGKLNCFPIFHYFTYEWYYFVLKPFIKLWINFKIMGGPFY